MRLCKWQDPQILSASANSIESGRPAASGGFESKLESFFTAMVVCFSSIYDSLLLMSSTCKGLYARC